MSAGAVKARKAAKGLERRAEAIERFFTMAEYTSRIDSAVVRCDGCGTLNVTSKSLPCFVCGCEIGQSA